MLETPRVFLAVAAVFLCGFTGLGFAQSDDPERLLADGIRQVEEGDLEVAVITLDTAVQRLSQPPAKEKDLVLAHLYLGMAHLGLSQWERAKEEMRAAWRNDHELRLDPKKFPPRVIQLYAEVSGAATAPAATDAPIVSPSPKAGGGSGKSKGLVIGALGAAAVAVGAIAISGGGSTPLASTTPTPIPPHLLDGRWNGGVDSTGVREVFMLTQPTSTTVTGYSFFENVTAGPTTGDIGSIRGTISPPISLGGFATINFSLLRSDVGVTYVGVGTFNAPMTAMSGVYTGYNQWTYIHQ
jgi:hypothetical protein